MMFMMITMTDHALLMLAPYLVLPACTTALATLLPALSVRKHVS
jgi:hypothetical protein